MSRPAHFLGGRRTITKATVGSSPVPGFLLVNPSSGDDSPTAEELCERAERLGIRTHVLEERDDPAALAREAEADALGVAGGDGSLGVVAAAAMDRDLPFVCVPFGTRNHFA